MEQTRQLPAGVQLLPAGPIEQAMDKQDGSYYVPRTGGRKGGTYVVKETNSNGQPVTVTVLRASRRGRPYSITMKSPEVEPTFVGTKPVTYKVLRLLPMVETRCTRTPSGMKTVREYYWRLLVGKNQEKRDKAIVIKPNMMMYRGKTMPKSMWALIRPGDIIGDYPGQAGYYGMITAERKNREPWDERTPKCVIACNGDGSAMVYDAKYGSHYIIPAESLREAVYPGFLYRPLDRGEVSSMSSGASSVSYTSGDFNDHVGGGPTPPQVPGSSGDGYMIYRSLGVQQAYSRPPPKLTQHFQRGGRGGRGRGRGRGSQPNEEHTEERVVRF